LTTTYNMLVATVEEVRRESSSLQMTQQIIKHHNWNRKGTTITVNWNHLTQSRSQLCRYLRNAQGTNSFIIYNENEEGHLLDLLNTLFSCLGFHQQMFSCALSATFPDTFMEIEFKLELLSEACAFDRDKIVDVATALLEEENDYEAAIIFLALCQLLGLGELLTIVFVCKNATCLKKKKRNNERKDSSMKRPSLMSLHCL